MKAVRFLGEGKHALVDVERRAPGAREIAVQVARTGICGTDIHILGDPGLGAEPGIILGHEIVGTVAAIGSDVTHVAPGDRVAIAPNLGCGVCRECARGRPMSCPNLMSLGFTHDGGLVEEAIVAAAMAHPIPDGVGWREAALAEPLSCVLEAFKRLDLHAGSSAAVIGGGPMGLLATCVLAAAGARPLVAFEPSEARAALAQRCGASHVADGSQIDTELWTQLTGDEEGPAVVVEAVGSLLPAAMDLVGPRGTVLQLGMSPGTKVLVEPDLITGKAIRIAGSDGAEFTIVDALELIAKDVAPFGEIVTAELPLEQFDDALERLKQGSEAKILITF